jgi:hypothetical protein
MILIEVLLGYLKRRIFAPRMLRLCSCPVHGRGAHFASLWILTAAAMAAVKPEKQAQEEKRCDEQEKDQYGSQKIIHGKVSVMCAAHAATRSRGSSADFPTAGANKKRRNREADHPHALLAYDAMAGVPVVTIYIFCEENSRRIYGARWA